MAESKFYNIEDLASILKLHPKTILRFIHEGKIKARKIGRAWMVAQSDLAEYAHAELAGHDEPLTGKGLESLSERVSVSAVIEIDEQDSAEASRISNSLLAVLNGKDESWGKTRFDHFYYPDIRRSKYVFYGSPRFIGAIMLIFETLASQKEEGHEVERL